MATGIVNFKANIKEFSKKIGVKIGVATEKISFDVHGKIIKRTPVDTGRARASFDVAIGSPPTEPPPPPAEGHKKGDPPAFSSPEFDPDGDIDGTKPVFIVSNVPYIENLENGSSKQSPAGMVRVSVAETAAEIDSLLATLDE